jgi:branched-chain amino acid transport system ATP-binding protein
MLEVSKLEVVYHRVSTAVQGVSFKVEKEGIFAIIGSNGAGKTTTLRAISGFLGIDNAMITDGLIQFKGERINGLLPHQITRKGIVLVPERNKVFETLSTHENLAILSPGDKDAKSAFNRIYEYFPALTPRRKTLAGLLSGGERQMLAMGQAIICSPQLLLIDELSQGLAPMIIKTLIESLLMMKRDLGLTIVAVEQNAAVALDIADYAVVMENGRIVFDGTPEKLSQHGDVKEFYLGVKDDDEISYRDVKQYRRRRRWW